MKVAIIITGLGMGGAERQACDLADKFSVLNHRVLIISMTGETVIRPRSDAIEIEAINMSKTAHGFIHAYIKTRKIINEFKPDVVHSHMVHANLFARLLRVTTFMPRLICTAHSSNEGSEARMLTYRFTDRLCNLSTNVSQEAVDISVKRRLAPAHRMIAVHNGIDTSRYAFNSFIREQLRSELDLTDTTPLLLAVGRLTAAKDYPNLLAAFTLLPDDFSHAQLVIIGGGEEEASLKEIVLREGLTRRVHFLGPRHDVADWMSAADFFVLPSAWEGFGLVVAEAMSCERVVVATDCGGVREVVGEAGLLVPPRQSHQLASAIAKALNMDADERAKIGRLARQRVIEHYSLEAATQRWLDIYQGKAC